MNDLVPISPHPLSRGIFGEIILPPLMDLDKVETPISRLGRILSGAWVNEMERSIYQALGENGEPFSMFSGWFSPTGVEQPYQTFVPVLTKVDARHWRLGILGHGRLKTFEESSSEKALMHAQELIAAWSQAEAETDLDKESK